MESYSEAYTSGSASWPLCAEDEDWEGRVSLEHVTAEQYHICAYELTKAWSERTRVPEGRSRAELDAFALKKLAAVFHKLHPARAKLQLQAARRRQ